MKNSFQLLLLFTFLTVPVIAQVDIYVLDRSTDETGRRFVYYLKEEFNRSSSFNLRSYIPRDKSILVAEILSMDKNAGDSRFEGITTMFTVIWRIESPDQMWGYYLNSLMGYSGSSRLKESAVDIVASTKRLLDELHQYLNEK
ncbi:MAG: hypothetical protein FMNOHCHN_00538 [Ignavibacteriaceae bacterium]|nr:hypothetical protein [Ignavibacteriaceae bacterium]